MIENQSRIEDYDKPLIGKPQAANAAKEKVTEILASYRLSDLTLVRLAPIIELSSGWRIAYDVYLDVYRVRQTVVMIFVDKRGNVIEEWNDLKQVITSLSNISLENEKSTSLASATAEAEKSYPNAIIESAEVVLDPKAQQAPDGLAAKSSALCWRLGLRSNMERRVVTVVDTPDGVRCRTTEQRVRYAAPLEPRMATRWRLGDGAVRLRSNSNGTKIQLLVDVKKFGAPLQAGPSDYWTVWSCIARAAQFVRELGYDNSGLYNTSIEFSETEISDERPFSSEKGALPVITFPNTGLWSEDITIITHELGHAFWHLMFTRIPLQIDKARFETPQAGILEGFADYFAAAVLADNAPEVRIGVYVAKIYASKQENAGSPNPFKLPRPVNGKPCIPASRADDPIDAYDIGRQWANFLWDVRTQWVALQMNLLTVNQIIFESHLRPRATVDAPAEPLACYFHSLQRTAGSEGTSLDWKQLAQRHGINVEPLPSSRGITSY